MSWRADFLQALDARDKREKADLDLFNACKALFQISPITPLKVVNVHTNGEGTDTRLADRSAADEAQRLGPARNEAGASPRPASSKGRPAPPASGSSTIATNPSSPSPSSSTVAQLKHDLAEAQRARVGLQGRLDQCTAELEQLRARGKADGRRIGELGAERTSLAIKVRDRDAELKGKAKLLEDIQDEMMTLNLQLNIAESRSANYETENKDLVARLMAWKGQQADAVNTVSKFS